MAAAVDEADCFLSSTDKSQRVSTSHTVYRKTNLIRNRNLLLLLNYLRQNSCVTQAKKNEGRSLSCENDRHHPHLLRAVVEGTDQQRWMSGLSRQR